LKKDDTDQAKFFAQTGTPQPNMSTTFMGKSKPEDDVCKEIPIVAHPKIKNKRQIKISISLLSPHV
jgi:hypothetical protein